MNHPAIDMHLFLFLFISKTQFVDYNCFYNYNFFFKRDSAVEEHEHQNLPEILRQKISPRHPGFRANKQIRNAVKCQPQH